MLAPAETVSCEVVFRNWSEKTKEYNHKLLLNLEDIILSEMSPSLKDKYHMIPLGI